MKKSRCKNFPVFDRRRILIMLASMPPLIVLDTQSTIAKSTAEVIGNILDRARYYLRTTNWAPRPEFHPLGKAFYCNVFVADVIREAEGANWNKVERPNLRGFREPLAREWADRKVIIKGWEVVFHADMGFSGKTAKQVLLERKPGDVVSNGNHVGIVSDDPGSWIGRVFSASSKTGAVELNNWSFRLPDQKDLSAADYEKKCKKIVKRFTVRRYIGS